MRKNGLAKVLIMVLIVSSVFACTACGGGDHPKVMATMENGETFTIKLYPEYAPQTCENFLNLVESGFYNGLTFHRALEGFIVQGGDPSGNGTGSAPNKIQGEFSQNGFSGNKMTHKRGTVAMARSDDFNSASCQFYICYADLPHLDGRYATFGEVVEGMETVDNFLRVKRSDAGVPEQPIRIQKIERIK